MTRITTLTAAFAAMLALLGSGAQSHAAAADRLEPPPVPADLEVDAEFRPYLISHAVGTQNYGSLPAGTGVAWTLLGPQATLFDGSVDQVMTHYLSPNPQEAGIARATWRHSRDTSAVWAVAVATSVDAAYVAPGAIAWLKLEVRGAQYGPNGGSTLVRTKFIQRVNTAGGVAPAAGCASASDIGKRVFVPYTTDYVFYR
jgi:hypothetical protein